MPIFFVMVRHGITCSLVSGSSRYGCIDLYSVYNGSVVVIELENFSIFEGIGYNYASSVDIFLLDFLVCTVVFSTRRTRSAFSRLIRELFFVKEQELLVY